MPYKNPKSGIYIITCLINNKHYIGKSINCQKRIRNHKKSLIKGNHHTFHLQRAWNKYGEQNFIFEILEEYPTEYLSSMECYWVNMLNSTDRKYGYNLFVPNPSGGWKIQDETRNRYSKAKSGIKLSEETKKKLSIANSNKKLTFKELENLMEGGRNYRKTEEYIKFLEKRKERVGLKLVIYNLKTGEFENFDSCVDISKYLKCHNGYIHECIDIPSKSVKGYRIFRKENFDPSIKYIKEKKKYSKDTVNKRIESMRNNYANRKNRKKVRLE
jgi:group I intron endonuclease